jgi:Asp-tRNA(Asn)/Glu-tRNA(Gln) amidotransferase A subunit family amidase
MAAEAVIAHRENGWYPVYNDEYAEETLELFKHGDNVPASEIGDERVHRFELKDRLENQMDEQDIDMWVSPAAPGPAPEGLNSTGDPAMNLPWTNAGIPTLTLPLDETDKGLPIGLQCSGRFSGDEELLGWAELLADDLGLLTGP